MEESMRKLLAALALCLCVTTAQADLFEDAVGAYNRGDYATALLLFRPFAEQGHVDAQFNLGLMYDKGEGTPQDYAAALKWYRLAAEQGDASAQYNVALMHDQGEGTAQDYAEALQWYRLAAAQGDADAQYNLGVMYGKGLGTPQDYAEAHKYYNLAASRLTDEEKRNLATTNRDNVAALMTPVQVAEAQKLAREWDKAHPR